MPSTFTPPNLKRSRNPGLAGASWLGLVLLLASAPPSPAEPRWILNHGRDALRLSAGQALLDFDQGLIRITPSGTDATLTAPLAEDERFEAAKLPFFALRYRYRTAQQQAGLFFTTDQLPVWSDASYSPFPVTGDSAWHDQIVDLRNFRHGNWKGIVTGVRLDPTNPSDTDSDLAISRFGFFPTEEEARKFLGEAKDAPDPAKATLFPKTEPANPPHSPEYFSRDRIRIGAWGNFRPVDLDEDYLKTYADCGFDWLLAMHSISGGLLRAPLLEWCDKYGIEVYLGDGAYTDPVAKTAAYGPHPSFRGHFVVDEPGSDEFDRLAEVCNRYTRLTNGRIPYINLLPMYANAAQLKYGAGAAAIQYYDPDPGLFRRYCDAFCEKFDTGYICTDIYPLNWAQNRRSTYRDYVESIHVIAASAREHRKDFWCFIQTFSWTPSKRTPTEAEFRWQVYSLLSFGCKGILCWTYAGAKPEYPSLVDSQGRKTNSWYDARTVFQEVRRISDRFVEYANLGAFTHTPEGTEPVPYLRLSQPVADFPAIQRIECPEPLLIGCFAKKVGPGSAFTVVNMSELEDVKTAEVALTIPGARITAYPAGFPTELKPDANGVVRLRLPPGEGIFVTVEPGEKNR